MDDFVSKTQRFNEIFGTPDKFDADRLSLYIGLLAEEYREGIDALLEVCDSLPEKSSLQTAILRNLSFALEQFEISAKDKEILPVVRALEKPEYENELVSLIDSFVDTSVVAVGATRCAGWDVEGVFNEIAESNLSKAYNDKGEFELKYAENGKIMKNSGYFAPDVIKYRKVV
jgi:hypothetical protein